VYQFSKVFVSEQSLSRSASASELRLSSPQTSSLLPSCTCLVSDRLISQPNVPASSAVSNPAELMPVLLPCTPLQLSSSSAVSYHEVVPSLDVADSEEVCTTQQAEKPVNPAACSCGGSRESQVLYLFVYGLMLQQVCFCSGSFDAVYCRWC